MDSEEKEEKEEEEEQQQQQQQQRESRRTGDKEETVTETEKRHLGNFLGGTGHIRKLKRDTEC